MSDFQDRRRLLLRGIDLQRSGDLPAAEAVYREVLASSPGHPETSYLLGQLLAHTQRWQEAIGLLRTAADLAPDIATFSLALADAHFAAGDAAAAAAVYRSVLERDAVSLDALCGLGWALAEEGTLDEAEDVLRMAAALAPGNGRAAAGLGSLLVRRGEWAQAAQELQRARAAGFSNAGVLNDLGVALEKTASREAAVDAWRAALELDPHHAQAWMNLGNLHKDEGAIAAARDCYAHVLHARPADCLRIRMGTLLPPIYASREEMLTWRRTYGEQLDALLAESLHPCDPITEGGHNNFYLCYQGENDRDLQIKLAQAYRRVYKPRYNEPPKRGAGGRIRIGFVSAFFTDHTIGELNRGIIAHLSRDEFEVFVFSVGRHEDPTARFIQSHAEHYQVLPSTLPEAEEEIAACGLDVLLYTDIGMEPFSYFLAFSRLAPVQCVTWGHPVTTGIDTIDCYLSSVWQEPEDAQKHYSEKLLRLSLLPAYYYPAPEPAPRSRAELGFSDAAHLYACPQSLFKFHPDFDALLQGILEADPAGLILIPEGHYPSWTEKLRTRFARAMPGLAERIRFLSRQGYTEYLQLLKSCDVMLDPLHFGGGKTTLDALSLGVPIVTLPGAFMRGRATYACYRQMDMDECVARDQAEYVNKAVALACAPEYREKVSRELRARGALLAERHDMVRELDQLLKGAVEAT